MAQQPHRSSWNLNALVDTYGLWFGSSFIHCFVPGCLQDSRKMPKSQEAAVGLTDLCWKHEPQRPVLLCTVSHDLWTKKTPNWGDNILTILTSCRLFIYAWWRQSIGPSPSQTNHLILFPINAKDFIPGLFPSQHACEEASKLTPFGPCACNANV